LDRVEKNRGQTLDNEFKVHVVDDDDAVRDALVEVLNAIDMPTDGFDSAQSFLAYVQPNTPGCLVLDIRMPGMSGLAMQKEMQAIGNKMPIIFITGHADISMAVEAMKLGAIDFIEKPFREQELLDSIYRAMEVAKRDYSTNKELNELQEGMKSLSPREKEVLKYIANGDASKVIAIELNISQRTVENHRANLLEKLNVRSTANLIKLMAINNKKN